MDQKYFDEIKAREQAASGEGWAVGTVTGKCDFEILEPGADRVFIAEVYYHNDADFIAHARTDIPLLLAEVERLTAENAKLKKALELMATYLVHFGRIDEMLCDDIPQPLHLKYQPKNDGDYENGPCIQCVQEYFQQQAQQTHETQEEAEK